MLESIEMIPFIISYDNFLVFLNTNFPSVIKESEIFGLYMIFNIFALIFIFILLWLLIKGLITLKNVIF